ncbi:pol polyprotein, partial [Pseudoloma neurophilia]
LKSQVRFLGFMIGNGKMWITNKHINDTIGIKEQKNRKDFQSQLGFLGYLRNFIPNFSMTMKSLYRLLKNEKKFIFTDEARYSLDMIKTDVMGNEPLILPDLQKPFIIYTDASQIGMSAALVQDNHGNLEIVQWASKRFLLRELNYSVTEKECLSVIWAVEKFKYFLHSSFTIRNDHHALKWLLELKEPKGRLARWIMKFSNFDFKFEYVKGSNNIVADPLSRRVVKESLIKMIKT